MAQTTNVAERIRLRLRNSHGTVDELLEVFEDWPTYNSHERLSWYADWDQMILGHLRELDAQYRGGEMDAAQAESYRALLSKLAERMPLIEQLDLTRPPVSLAP